jgi:hypothetical protein
MKNAATGISQFRSIALVVQQEGIEVAWNVFNVCPVVVIGDWSGLFCRGHGHHNTIDHAGTLPDQLTHNAVLLEKEAD